MLKREHFVGGSSCFPGITLAEAQGVTAWKSVNDWNWTPGFVFRSQQSNKVLQIILLRKPK